eukprot:scaffold5438_cov237-Pinguiococcus_pyrenoidosus.AAC.7
MHRDGGRLDSTYRVLETLEAIGLKEKLTSNGFIQPAVNAFLGGKKSADEAKPQGACATIKLRRCGVVWSYPCSGDGRPDAANQQDARVDRSPLHQGWHRDSPALFENDDRLLPGRADNCFELPCHGLNVFIPLIDITSDEIGKTSVTSVDFHSCERMSHWACPLRPDRVSSGNAQGRSGGGCIGSASRGWLASWA